MSPEVEKELIAEIESFRADLRRRAEEDARREREINGLKASDVSWLPRPKLRALISHRHENARTQRRLADVERRLAELEAERG